MSHVSVKRAGAAGVLLGLALVLTALAPSARANHDNPVKLCEDEFNGEFHPFRNYPIRGRRGARLGRLAVTFQGPVVRRGVRGWRACAVTILNRHNRRRFAAVGVRQADEPNNWRSDRGMWYQYAGPVVRWSPYARNCLIWRGTIRGGSRILEGYCP
jgi:hypothetical protein